MTPARHDNPSPQGLHACMHAAAPRPSPAHAAAVAHAPHAHESVVLDVGGMKCGGCSAAVKRMLLQQPGVTAAAVNLLTETAAVQFSGDAKALGPAAAEVLTSKVRLPRLASAVVGGGRQGQQRGMAACGRLGLLAASIVP